MRSGSDVTGFGSYVVAATLYTVECRCPRLHARPSTATAAAREHADGRRGRKKSRDPRTYADGSHPPARKFADTD